MRGFWNYLVSNFGFDNSEDFHNSFIHTKLMLLTIPVAAISSFVQNLFGLQMVTIASFVLLVILELITGLVASKIKGVKIQSKKFGRFGLKVFVWLSLLFILNTLMNEYETQKDTLFGMAAHDIFWWLRGTLFIYINLEYIISILENISVISGKSNNKIIKIIKKKLSKILDV